MLLHNPLTGCSLPVPALLRLQEQAGTSLCLCWQGQAESLRAGSTAAGGDLALEGCVVVSFKQLCEQPVVSSPAWAGGWSCFSDHAMAVGCGFSCHHFKQKSSCGCSGSCNLSFRGVQESFYNLCFIEALFMKVFLLQSFLSSLVYLCALPRSFQMTKGSLALVLLLRQPCSLDVSHPRALLGLMSKQSLLTCTTLHLPKSSGAKRMRALCSSWNKTPLGR